MLKINRFNDYYEATFLGGNLYAFTLNDLIAQLWEIYDFKLSLFHFEWLN